ncbi:MAG: helix-turn-helix domain-containing protein [Elusimicrobiota bacterium]
MNEENGAKELKLTQDQKDYLESRGLDKVKPLNDYPAKEVAEALGKSLRTIQRWCKKKKLKASRYLGVGDYRILGKHLIEFALKAIPVPDYIEQLDPDKYNHKIKQPEKLDERLEHLEQEVACLKRQIKINGHKVKCKKVNNNLHKTRKLIAPKGYETVETVANKHRKRRDTVVRWCRKGKVKSIRYNGRGPYYIQSSLN